jgi:hypothetical protein
MVSLFADFFIYHSTWAMTAAVLASGLFIWLLVQSSANPDDGDTAHRPTVLSASYLSGQNEDRRHRAPARRRSDPNGLALRKCPFCGDEILAEQTVICDTCREEL